uniref:Vps16_C domain-containing protein n=1 Tax=Steinernema glaseri TaxID=37863 RepID=A0A1I8AKW0_9BILA
MDAHRRFNFSDPEDSYWNGEGANASNGTVLNLFDDVSSLGGNAAIARAALDDLFDTHDKFAFDDASSSFGGSEVPASVDEEIDHLAKSIPNSTHGRERSVTCSLVPDKTLCDLNRLAESPYANEGFGALDRKKDKLSSASVVSDCSIGSFSSESTAQIDFSRLKAEHKKLQRHLENVRSEKYRAPDVEESIKRLSRCEPVPLDLYRTKAQKLELLDAAIRAIDSDVILTVVLFLKKSLADSIFRDILLRRPEAAECYVAYLEDVSDFSELTHTLFSLGRNEEAAMMEFCAATRKTTTDGKIQALKKSLVSGFSSPALLTESKIVAEYIDLLERQVVIDSTDDEVVKSGRSPHFKQYPKTASLVGQPLLTTVYYCSLYHYDLPINSYASPLSLKAVFNLNDKEFLWMSISALSRIRRWTEIERLLSNRKLLGGMKMTVPFPWHAFFQHISRNEAPPKEFLLRWLSSIGDLEERISVSEQFPDALSVTLEAIVALRNRKKLVALITKLTPHTIEYSKAQAALNNTAIKWKN